MEAAMSDALKKLIEAVEAGERSIHDLAVTALSQIDWKFIRDSYEGSIDAAKALHDSLLPGWQVHHFGQQWDNKWWISLLLPVEGDEQGNVTRHSQTSATFDQTCPARAWLIAILKAKLREDRG